MILPHHIHIHIHILHSLSAIMYPSSSFFSWILFIILADNMWNICGFFLPSANYFQEYPSHWTDDIATFYFMVIRATLVSHGCETYCYRVMVRRELGWEGLVECIYAWSSHWLFVGWGGDFFFLSLSFPLSLWFYRLLSHMRACSVAFWVLPLGK